jgi:hypothetical protein
MNITESRRTEADAAGGGPNPALLAALTTEHYTLQSARSSTIVEANGRSMLFLSTVSGATVTLALVAQLDRLGQTFVVFALAVLPALLALGLTSYARLADLAVHDAYYARAIGRIRSFYLRIEPTAAHYWLLPGGDDAHAVMRQTGQRHSRWHHLSHTATAVAAVTAAVAGVLAGLGVALVTRLPVSVSAALAMLVAVTVLVCLLVDQERRWRLSDRGVRTLFLPDGSPATTVASLPTPSTLRGPTPVSPSTGVAG